MTPSKRERLHLAEVNDNGGPWFLCVSARYQVHHLNAMFSRGEMPRALVDTVGGILGDTTIYRGARRLYMQVHLALSHHKLWQVEAALSDLHITTIECLYTRPTRNI